MSLRSSNSCPKYNFFGVARDALRGVSTAQTRKALLGRRAFLYEPGDFLLSHTLARAVPSGLRGLTTVFGMGTGGSLSLRSPRNWRQKGTDRGSDLQVPLSLILTGWKTQEGKKAALHALQQHVCAVVFYGQAERAISNGKLNALLRLHIRPIKLVVYQCPS